jgi:hypothetical protein
MKSIKISLVILTLAILLVGSASAATPLTVGGDWLFYNIPQSATLPIPSTDNPFTYTSAVPTHIRITDGLCVGDQPAVFDLEGNMLGSGQPVTSTYPECVPYATDGDTAYAGGWSHACINMPASPAGAAISFNIKNIAMYSSTQGDGGWVRVEEGYCPTTSAPEFPSIALPIGMILGLIFVVYSLRKTPKE